MQVWIDMGGDRESDRIIQLLKDRSMEHDAGDPVREGIEVAIDAVSEKQKNDRRGRKLCFLLRHDSSSVGGADKHGWVSVGAILRLTGWTPDSLRQLVSDDEKNRYEFDPHRDRIRARQGHSFKVDLELSPATPPSFLYHGTTKEAWVKIRESGLRPMSRQHVHLSTDVATAVNVAGRRHRASVVLRIASGEMARCEIPFYFSSNGVWLVPGVPQEFISVHSTRPEESSS